MSHSERRKKASNPARVAELKQKINNKEYLEGAISRIAQVISNEILGISQGADNDERKWEGSL
jgi:anti-sigma28 factor (negative regulator of flagellin synthesis)